MRTSFSLTILLLASFLPCLMMAQSEAVSIAVSGSKSITRVDPLRLHEELSALFLATNLTASDVTALTSAVNGLAWADVLAQGAAADRNIDLGGHDLDNAGTVAVDLVLADSLVVTKVIQGQIGSLANHTSDALSEGSTNQYFTLTRSRNAITLSDAGGDGSLTYNGTTGEITYTGPSAAEVRAHFSPGTGVDITDGTVSIGQDVGTAADVAFSSVTADFVGNLTGSVTGNVTGNLTGDVTGTVSNLSNHTTSGLAEGSNLYFTDARADDRIAAASVTDLSDVTDAGSGAIITESERTLISSLNAALGSLNEALGMINELQTAHNQGFSCGEVYFFDQHAYSTVQIGTQCWFAENLRSTHYNDDTEIASEVDDAAWSTADQTGFAASAVYGEGTSVCNAPCDEVANLAAYGRLYNWYAVNTGKLCPDGWHVPSDGEWTELTTFVGPDPGLKLKSQSWDGDNSTGFSALPGGYRIYHGYFYSPVHGHFWTSTASGTAAYYRYFQDGSNNVSRFTFDKRNGYSVRCVLD